MTTEWLGRTNGSVVAHVDAYNLTSQARRKTCFGRQANGGAEVKQSGTSLSVVVVRNMLGVAGKVSAGPRPRTTTSSTPRRHKHISALKLSRAHHVLFLARSHVAVFWGAVLMQTQVFATPHTPSLQPLRGASSNGSGSGSGRGQRGCTHRENVALIVQRSRARCWEEGSGTQHRDRLEKQWRERVWESQPTQPKSRTRETHHRHRARPSSLGRKWARARVRVRRGIPTKCMHLREGVAQLNVMTERERDCLVWCSNCLCARLYSHLRGPFLNMGHPELARTTRWCVCLFRRRFQGRLHPRPPQLVLSARRVFP